METKEFSLVKSFDGSTKHNVYGGKIQCTKCGYTTDSGSGNNRRECSKGGYCNWRVVLSKTANSKKHGKKQLQEALK